MRHDGRHTRIPARHRSRRDLCWETVVTRARRSVWTTLVAASAFIAAAVASAGTAAAATPPRFGPPQSVATADGHVQVFAVGSGLIWQNWQNPSTGAHGNWVVQPSPIPFVGTVSLVPRAGQHVIDIFARTSTDAIVETWYDWATGGWGGWIELGAASGTGDPRAFATADGHDQVFITAGGRVQENWFGPARGDHGAFASPTLLPPSATVGRVAVAARPGQTVLDVFTRAANGNLLETWYSINGAWGGWINLGGSTSNDPAAIAVPIGGDTVQPDTPFRDQLIANNGTDVAVNWFEPTTGHHGGWSAFGDRPPTTMTGAPVLVPVPGQPQIGIFLVDVFLRGTDGRIYQGDFQTFAGGVQGWVVLAGSTSNPPDAVGTSDGNDQVVTTSGGGAAVDAFSHWTGAMSGWRPLQ
jgi:hypothetical protein